MYNIDTQDILYKDEHTSIEKEDMQHNKIITLLAIELHLTTAIMIVIVLEGRSEPFTGKANTGTIVLIQLYSCMSNHNGGFMSTAIF